MSMKQGLFNHNKKPKTPKSPASPTVGDLFQAERPSNYLSNNDLSPTLEKEPQQEEERFSFQPIKKFSVLAKVKEKARKWRQNLGKKKPGQDSDPTPSWGVAFEDYEKDEDPRRLGAPSKLFTLRRSSSSYKEGMRMRVMPGLSINEKHVLSYSADRGYSEHCQKVMPNRRLPIPSLGVGEDIKPTASLRDEPPSYEEVVQEAKEEERATDFESEETEEEVKVMPPASPETVEEAKELSQICKKLIQADQKGRSPTPSPEEGAFEDEKQEIDSPPAQMKSLDEAVTEELAPAAACATSISEETQQSIDSEEQQVLSLPAITTTTRKEASSVGDNDHDYEEDCGSGDQRKWDKGVSVKEYIKNKLEPGDDERALSQVISEAISPRRTPGDKGVMEKVKEAVTLLLLAEQRQMEREQEEKQKQRSTSQLLRHSSSSLQIPISTNAYEDELEGHNDFFFFFLNCVPLFDLTYLAVFILGLFLLLLLVFQLRKRATEGFFRLTEKI